MTQEQVWDKEYKDSQFLTKENKPQSDVVRFVKWLKKEKGIKPEGLSVLDLGSGTGRNSFYFAELGAKVLGLEISGVAIEIAKNNLIPSLNVKYIKQSIGDIFPLQDFSVDIAIDITSSNSLTENEREIYFSETLRVLKPNGYFFVKALCKDGDENAKYLLKNNPSSEYDTYIMPETKIVERVWSKQDFIDSYGKYFKIISLEKKTTYTKINNRSYKRNFWLAYMQK